MSNFKARGRSKAALLLAAAESEQSPVTTAGTDSSDTPAGWTPGGGQADCPSAWIGPSARMGEGMRDVEVELRSAICGMHLCKAFGASQHPLCTILAPRLSGGRGMGA
ncbi:hypothetical protein BU16DRAFT_539910 [Lophium mytilinum]|uniref:Uncharacterized protein n=1 Tax=Lophium mytilinum TaxID=390894 RepID=A0A6A6QRL2_9PEZI|nr:hypothetical protein BU16DRAFT_539910 [Lophium mytilinum]